MPKTKTTDCPGYATQAGKLSGLGIIQGDVKSDNNKIVQILDINSNKNINSEKDNVSDCLNNSLDNTTNNGKTLRFLNNYTPITLFNTTVYALLDSGSDVQILYQNISVHC